MLGSTVHKGIGGAVFTALVSSVFNRSLKPALAVLGNISIGGAIERALNFSDRVSLLSENGAKNVLVPMDNLQEMANLPAAILGKTDVPFYSSSQMLIQKKYYSTEFFLKLLPQGEPRCTQVDSKVLASSKGLNGLEKYLSKACYLLAKCMLDTNKCYKWNNLESVSANYSYLCPTIDNS